MDKKEYVLSQFKKTWNKKYENYCIERIYNKLDNPNLKFVTQQMFTRKGNKIALADMYFPQLKLSIEIDENHHKYQTDRDNERTKDILAKMKDMETVIDFEPKEKRINTDLHQTLDTINTQIDEVVNDINNRIKLLKEPLEWNLSVKTVEQLKSEKKIYKDGEISLHTVWEISELFDKGYKQGSHNTFFEVATGANAWVWCPKLKLEGIDIKIPYINEISADGNTIYEFSKNNNDEYVSEVLSQAGMQQERIVFPYCKNELEEINYVFKGIYKLDVNRTKKKNKRVWKRIRKEIELSMYTPKKD